MLAHYKPNPQVLYRMLVHALFFPSTIVGMPLSGPPLLVSKAPIVPRCHRYNQRLFGIALDANGFIFATAMTAPVM